MDFVIFILSIAALIFGADFIIHQSERIALRFNISEFVIGSTLIALGTSLPEMATSMAASFDHKADLAIANAVGSNIINITLVLGLVFLISKPFISVRDFFAKDSLWALLPILIFILMSLDGHIDKFDASLLFILMFAYLLFLFNNSKDDIIQNVDESFKDNFSWIKSSLLLLVGFTMVVVGANFAIDSASNIATQFGVSQWAIGVVIIAFGTSLPELIVSVSAARKGKVGMVIGNIIGSNLANTTMVIGGAAMVNTLTVNLGKYYFDMALLTIGSIMLVYITANKLYSRPAGILLLILLALFLHEKVYPLATLHIAA